MPETIPVDPPPLFRRFAVIADAIPGKRVYGWRFHMRYHNNGATSPAARDVFKGDFWGLSAFWHYCILVQYF